MTSAWWCQSVSFFLVNNCGYSVDGHRSQFNGFGVCSKPAKFKNLRARFT